MKKLKANERATILAALRYYQASRLGKDRVIDQVQLKFVDAISTDGGRFPALTEKEIDALCSKVNTGQWECIRKK